MDGSPSRDVSQASADASNPTAVLREAIRFMRRVALLQCLVVVCDFIQVRSMTIAQHNPQ